MEQTQQPTSSKSISLIWLLIIVVCVTVGEATIFALILKLQGKAGEEAIAKMSKQRDEYKQSDSTYQTIAKVEQSKRLSAKKQIDSLNSELSQKKTDYVTIVKQYNEKVDSVKHLTPDNQVLFLSSWLSKSDNNQ